MALAKFLYATRHTFCVVRWCQRVNATWNNIVLGYNTKRARKLIKTKNQHHAETCVALQYLLRQSSESNYEHGAPLKTCSADDGKFPLLVSLCSLFLQRTWITFRRWVMQIIFKCSFGWAVCLWWFSLQFRAHQVKPEHFSRARRCSVFWFCCFFFILLFFRGRFELTRQCESV